MSGFVVQPLRGDGVEFDPEEVLGRSLGPAAGRMRLLATPPWSRVEGKSQVNFPQMPPLRGGICMGVDSRKHPFTPVPPRVTPPPRGPRVGRAHLD